MKKLIFVLAVILCATGCATRSAVKQELEPLGAKLSTLEKRMDALDAGLKKIGEKAAAAAATAKAAAGAAGTVSPPAEPEEQPGLFGTLKKGISSILPGGKEDTAPADPASRAEAAAARAEAAAKRAEAAAEAARKLPK